MNDDSPDDRLWQRGPTSKPPHESTIAEELTTCDSPNSEEGKHMDQRERPITIDEFNQRSERRRVNNKDTGTPLRFTIATTRENQARVNAVCKVENLNQQEMTTEICDFFFSQVLPSRPDLQNAIETVLKEDGAKSRASAEPTESPPKNSSPPSAPTTP